MAAVILCSSLTRCDPWARLRDIQLLNVIFFIQGKVYVAGLGDSGQLGLGCRKAMSQDPTLVSFQYDDYTIVQIVAGIAHNST